MVTDEAAQLAPPGSGARGPAPDLSRRQDTVRHTYISAPSTTHPIAIPPWDFGENQEPLVCPPWAAGARIRPNLELVHPHYHWGSPPCSPHYLQISPC